jgi:catechol 2,3-dioxygenase-like lactoylglutathione lyase family enzyme
MERAVPVLPADDLSAAKSFYVDKLGFRITFEQGDGKSGIMGVERGTMAHHRCADVRAWPPGLRVTPR